MSDGFKCDKLICLKKIWLLTFLISNKMNFLLRFQSVLNYQYVFDILHTVSNAFLINRYFPIYLLRLKGYIFVYVTQFLYPLHERISCQFS